PRGMLGLREQRLVPGRGDAPRAPRERKDAVPAEPGRELLDERRDHRLRAGRQLLDDDLADVQLGHFGIVVLPVARAQVPVAHAVAIARSPAERLERPSHRVEPDAGRAEGQKAHAIVGQQLAALGQQPMDARSLRRREDIVSPQRVEELGDCHLPRYAKPARACEAPTSFTLMKCSWCNRARALAVAEAGSLTVREDRWARSLELVRQVRLEPEL